MLANYLYLAAYMERETNSVFNARGLSALTSFSYVGSVYIFPGGRSPRRDDLPVMWRRIAGICLLTAFSVANFGYDWRNWAGTINRKVLMYIFVAFSVLHYVYVPGILAFGLPKVTLRNKQQKLKFARDILIGPLSEELVYRGVIVAIYKDGSLSNTQILRENFLYFGFAHLHHAVMSWLGEGVPLSRALTLGLVQFAMTGLFATYACFWVLKTGSIWPAVVSHMVCNFYGPPRFSGPFWYQAATVAGLGFALLRLKQL